MFRDRTPCADRQLRAGVAGPHDFSARNAPTRGDCHRVHRSGSSLGGQPFVGLAVLLRTSSMSVGLYTLAVGAHDGQSPHSEDEVYVELAGQCQMTVAEDTQELEFGSVVVVEKGVPHRFHDISNELRVLVFFAPA